LKVIQNLQLYLVDRQSNSKMKFKYMTFGYFKRDGYPSSRKCVIHYIINIKNGFMNDIRENSLGIKSIIIIFNFYKIECILFETENVQKRLKTSQNILKILKILRCIENSNINIQGKCYISTISSMVLTMKFCILVNLHLNNISITNLNHT